MLTTQEDEGQIKKGRAERSDRDEIAVGDLPLQKAPAVGHHEAVIRRDQPHP